MKLHELKETRFADPEKAEAMDQLYHWLDLDCRDFPTFERAINDKNTVLKDLLKLYKDGTNPHRMKMLIGYLRTLGHDWPELKSIEKSMESK